VGHWLFDLKNDIGETTDVADTHPDIVARLEQHAENARATLGDTLTGRQGSEVRPAGQLAGVAQKAPGP
jgi:arylsulfatase A